MSRTNPLELPEIRLHIGAHLDPPALVLCLRVCKQWRDSFLPLVWKYVGIATGDTPLGPSVHALERHHQLVETLHIQSNLPAQYALNYPRLTKLSLEPTNSFGEFSTKADPTSLVRLNPSLTKLELQDMEGYLRGTFWRAVSESPHLDHLFLYGSIRDELYGFWRGRRPRTDILVNMTFPQIRTLELCMVTGVDGQDLLQLLCRCPGLERLVWSSAWSGMASVASRFTELVARRAWPRLTRLSLLFRFITMEDREIELALNGLMQATELSFSGSGFGLHAFCGLRPHFETLKELNVAGCSAVCSTMLNDIMCSCPLLEALRGDSIEASDVLGGRPWVCLPMVRLSVRFMFEEDDQDLQPRMFERLSTLRQLEVLHTGYDANQALESYHNTLDFRLQSGLGSLVTVRKMASLSVEGTRQMLDNDEIGWIVQHWCGLVYIDGQLSVDPDTDRSLRALLELHGVVVNPWSISALNNSL